MFPYQWRKKDFPEIDETTAPTVFSCFSGGGGSSMGYKLAGFNVIGCTEIDQKMMDCYLVNLKPKYHFLESIQNFKNKKEFPKELYTLDVLDGSPPCSSFSISGAREKYWGKEKKFKEGQIEQILDTLFFDFIDLAKRLRPKIVIAENVKGLLMGNAKQYVSRIYAELENAGYTTQHILLNSNKMGIPQKRERVFFIALRKDLIPQIPHAGIMFPVPKLQLKFNFPEILFKQIYQPNNTERMLSGKVKKLWENRNIVDIDLESVSRRTGKPNSFFSHKFIHTWDVPNTIIGSDVCCLFDEPRYRSIHELLLCSTFPLDYDFCNHFPIYIMGMSVPPVMIAQIAWQIKQQWINKIK